jgi:hypothetical protein
MKRHISLFRVAHPTDAEDTAAMQIGGYRAYGSFSLLRRVTELECSRSQAEARRITSPCN